MKTSGIKLLLLIVSVLAAIGFCLSSNKQARQSASQSVSPSSPNWTIDKTGRLSKELKEISGWEFVSDSTLAAINDSGNEPFIYLLDTTGKILHRARLTVENVDFEDVAVDTKGYLYVGDIGNNDNNRGDLKIYQFRIADLWQDTLSPSAIIAYSYAGQKQFPPGMSERNFDAESLVWKDDSLLVFTKCRTIPFTGKSYCYKIPASAGSYRVSPSFFIRTGMRSWLNDAVTGASLRGKMLYLLTQDRMIQYDFSEAVPRKKASFSILPLTQKESIAVNNNGTIYICDEKQKVIGGGTVFRIHSRK